MDGGSMPKIIVLTIYLSQKIKVLKATLKRVKNI